MYSITTTNGFIVDSRPYGEAGRLMSIFTRDLGLVRAMAQGIRLEKSKLRYSAQLYSFGIFSFVRGKEYWRLTDADESRAVSLPSLAVSPLHRFVSSGETDSRLRDTARDLIVRLALLLRRLLHGEEAHSGLFDCIFACVSFLNVNHITEEQTQTLESLAVARILSKLGYIGYDKELDGYLQSIEITRGLLDVLKNKRTILNKHINKALKESHL